MTLPIPIQVLYAGLGGTVLALIVATATNRWSLRVFCLLALRLAIGWHFLFEGLHKVHSHYVGASETNRPFSSEIYFTAGEGPLAREMRARIGGDPEAELRAKLAPQNADKLAAVPPNLRLGRGPNGEVREAFPNFLAKRRESLIGAERQALNEPATADEFARKTAEEYAERQVADLEAFARMAPEAVQKDWADFTKTLAEKYKLTAEEQARLDGKLDAHERIQLVAGFQAAETADATRRKALIDISGPGDIGLAAMAAYGKWVAGVEPRASKLKFVSTGDALFTGPQRLEYVAHRKDDVAELEKRAADKLGVGYGHEMKRAQEAKALVAAARAALLTDADELVADYKKAGVAETVGKRFVKKAPGPAIEFGGLNPDPDAPSPTDEQKKKADEQRAAKLDALAAFALPPEPVFASLPPDIKDVWGRYLGEFKAAYTADEKAAKAADEAYGLVTQRLAFWYYGLDEFSGKPPTWTVHRLSPIDPGFVGLLKKYQDAKAEAAKPAPTPAKYEPNADGVWFAESARRLVARVEAKKAKDKADKAASDAKAAFEQCYAALERKYTDLKTALTGAIPAEVVAGPVTEAPKKSKLQESLDWQTRWGITAIGAMLMLGLFTRLACLAGFVFLTMTYLTHPPFPWLPLPPGTEGNPLYVNKNVIEALALLVIMVHPTGRWMGLDAILHRVIFRNSREYVVEPVAPPPPPAKK